MTKKSNHTEIKTSTVARNDSLSNFLKEDSLFFIMLQDKVWFRFLGNESQNKMQIQLPPFSHE
jgi:hypothetical protein